MVKVKICGVKNKSLARMAVEVGADAVGLVINNSASPRNLTLQQAAEIASSLPPLTSSVAVLTPRSLQEVLEVAREVKPHILQIHSYPDLDFLERASKMTEARIIGALAIETELDPGSPAASELVKRAKALGGVVDGVLIDTLTATAPGGTGVKGNWPMARRIRDTLYPTPIILAGGLTPRNVEESIAVVKPYAVDVSSGVEASPGVKDPMLVEEFIRRAKGG